MIGRSPDVVGRFFGAAIMAIGALVFTACGLCTLSFTGQSLHSMAQRPAGHAPVLGGLLFFAIVGGLPTFGGFMLMLLGWQMSFGPPATPLKPATKASDE
jgi:hypothetical protein